MSFRDRTGLPVTSSGSQNGVSDITNGQGLAFASTPSSSAASFSHDALGNLQPTTDTANLVVATSGYTPYGKPDTANTAVAFGYHQALHIGDQIHLNARSYDPALGRFTSRDQQVQANIVQHISPFCGTYQAERQVARKALEDAGQSLATIDLALRRADEYFRDQLLVKYDDPLGRPLNRPSCWAAA